MVALFLLAGSAIACLSLLSQASKNQRITLETLTATRFAHQCFERVEQWAYDPDAFATGWALYADTTVTDPNFPDMTCRLQASPYNLDLITPNSSLEAPWSPDQRRVANRTRAIKATVQWYSNRPRSLALQTWIAAPISPLRSPDPISLTWVSGSVSPMAVNATATYRAELLDSAGQPIPGVTFHWVVEPDFSTNDPGMGSVELVDRTGTSARFIHHSYATDPSTPSVAGLAHLRVFCRYAGQELSLASAPIQLLP